MLLISRISNLEMHSDEWKAARVGRLFTSSNMHYIMGEDGIGKGGMTYIRRKVFETLSGVSTDAEVDTDAVRWGLVYEPENIRKSCVKMGIEFVVTQKLIEVDKTEASTPDALIIRSKHPNGLSYDVSPFEGKSYQHEKHMRCAECETPQQIKKVDAPAYWQLLHQTTAVDSLNGFLSYFHPDLPADNWGHVIIEFRKAQKIVEKGKDVYPIVEDLKLMNRRKTEALEIYNRLLYKYKAA